ncbi:restriction endonuclease subunit S [Gordonia liuliyuniae]|uniref:Restriction endonuclease subunit S n=1 Tax=Gordonia liuliyuniae TaxID=2911517 RepID=A0ABS9IX68_9ACTN|nr:restriction endonuclease subunit S [Gordonia liuliyuniae]MCF8590159.1 restriction endonuclease subunit S [Gordonia liuliyuniae]
MSRIDELIQELCPDGVEYAKIGVLAQVGTGSSDRKDAICDGNYPFYVRSKDVMRIDSYEFDEEALIIPGEGGIGEIFHYVNGKYALHQRAYRIHFTDARVHPRFAYFYFSTYFKRFIVQKAVSATVTSIRKPMITDFPFPMPPLEVQREIVRILDQFTQLEAELEAELEARRAQYEHYRHDVLTFGSEVATSTLGDLARNLDSRRKPVTREARVPGEIPYYGASGVVDYVSEYIFEGDYLLVSEDGANLLARSTPIAFSISGKTWVNNHAHVLEFPTYAERRFVEFYLNSIDLVPYISGAAQPKLNKANLNKIPVPDPPMAAKEQIVEVLDKFDALVNDISIGLPAELSARRQQYEYYRDRLLTFKEAV